MVCIKLTQAPLLAVGPACSSGSRGDGAARGWHTCDAEDVEDDLPAKVFDEGRRDQEPRQAAHLQPAEYEADRPRPLLLHNERHRMPSSSVVTRACLARSGMPLLSIHQQAHSAHLAAL